MAFAAEKHYNGLNQIKSKMFVVYVNLDTILIICVIDGLHCTVGLPLPDQSGYLRGSDDKLGLKLVSGRPCVGIKIIIRGDGQKCDMSDLVR